MITSGRSLSPSLLRRVFRGPVEFRAGWRLFVFLTIVIVLLRASNLVVGLHGMEDTTLFLVRKAMDFLIFLLATRIMGLSKVEPLPSTACPGAGCSALSFGSAFCWALQPSRVCC